MKSHNITGDVNVPTVQSYWKILGYNAVEIHVGKYEYLGIM